MLTMIGPFRERRTSAATRDAAGEFNGRCIVKDTLGRRGTIEGGNPNKTTMLRLITSISFMLAVKPRTWMVAGLACLLSTVYVDQVRPVRATQELTVTSSFENQESVAPDESIELTLSRPLSSVEGRIAVLIGSTDLSSLFTFEGLSLKYGSGSLPLPMGETEVTVYTIASDDEWKEIARFP